MVWASQIFSYRVLLITSLGDDVRLLDHLAQLLLVGAQFGVELIWCPHRGDFLPRGLDTPDELLVGARGLHRLAEASPHRRRDASRRHQSDPDFERGARIS